MNSRDAEQDSTGPMKVRGHHLCCSVCFLGSGMTEARDYFGIDNAMPELVKIIQEAPDTPIELVDTFDDVCNMCSIKTAAGCGRGDDTEAQNAKLTLWDRRIFEALGVKIGDRTTFAKLYRVLEERIPDIGVICTNCTSSKPYGFKTYVDGLKKLNK